jgi:hypothetical protein
MKIFVGIDIAKLNHFAATISSYDDNRWWTSWYQTLGKGGTTS